MDPPETEPIAVIEQRMKWLVIVSTVLFIGTCIGMRWGRYRAGFTCGEEDNLLLLVLVHPFILVPAGIVSFVLTNSVTVLTAFCFRRVLGTASLCLLLTWGTWFAVQRDGRPSLFLEGFRDFVIGRVTLDDLRQIRKVFINTPQNNAVIDTHRVVEKLAGKGRASVRTNEDTVTLEWGGGFEHWGITIGRERIEPDTDSYREWSRLADDILVFSGD